MIIKHKDCNQRDIDFLSDFLEREIPDDKKRLIDRALKCLYSGNKGEETSAYYLDFEFKHDKNWVLIHDLRIEHNGDVAQIDHLLIGRSMDIYVIESKNYASGVSISEEGDFSYFYNNRPCAIESPIAQNERHIELLKRFFSDTDLLPKRLNITINPKFHSIVLVSPKSRLTKPAKGFYDCSVVMKSDKFTERFKNDLKREDLISDMIKLTRETSLENLQRFSEKLVLQHKPLVIDYRARFGLWENAVAEPRADYDPGIPQCPVCGEKMVLREAKKGKNEGKKFWGCSTYPVCRGAVNLNEDIEKQKDTLDGVGKDVSNKEGPLCPLCEGAMVRRVSKKTSNAGQPFWGCNKFPRCKGVVSIVAEEA